MGFYDIYSIEFQAKRMSETPDNSHSDIGMLSKGNDI